MAPALVRRSCTPPAPTRERRLRAPLVACMCVANAFRPSPADALVTPGRRGSYRAGVALAAATRFRTMPVE
jgi:hypothetical protein